MPRPISQEIEAMNSIERRLSSSELQDRIKLFGPITRVCLSRTTEEYDRYKNALERKLHEFSYKDLAPMLRASSFPTTQAHGLTWWILQLDATNTLQDPVILWGSPHIFNHVTRISDDKSLAELEDDVGDRTLLRPLPRRQDGNTKNGPPTSSRRMEWISPYAITQ
jgi:hypothetical protein